MSKSLLHRSLRLESLENRELFAGDVSAYVSSDGALNIIEKSGHIGGTQAIELSRPSFDFTGMTIRVKGLQNANGGTTLIDGAAYKDFRVATRNINVNLGGGADWVQFKNAPLNNIYADMGAGKDVVNFYDGMKTTGTSTLRMGADNDFVGLYAAQIGNDNLDNLNVYMDAGADIFYSKGTNAQAIVRGNLNLNMNLNDTDRDVDTITMENNKIGGSLVMRTGAGDDVASLKRQIVGNDLLLSMGADKDSAKLSEVQVLDDFWSYMGSGDDSLDLDDVWADRLETYGESGRDTLTRRRPGQVNVYVQPNGFEVYNYA